MPISFAFVAVQHSAREGLPAPERGNSAEGRVIKEVNLKPPREEAPLVTVGISGSYGGLNLGDEAILASAIAQLKATIPGVEIVVFARNAEHTRRTHDADRVLSPRPATRDEQIGRASCRARGGQSV